MHKHTYNNTQSHLYRNLIADAQLRLITLTHITPTCHFPRVQLGYGRDNNQAINSASLNDDISINSI